MEQIAISIVRWHPMLLILVMIGFFIVGFVYSRKEGYSKRANLYNRLGGALLIIILLRWVIVIFAK